MDPVRTYVPEGLPQGDVGMVHLDLKGAPLGKSDSQPDQKCVITL